MTIPNVAIRAVRPCHKYDRDTNTFIYCVFYSADDCGGYCNIIEREQYKRDSYKLKYNGYCKYNFTKDELKELIDSGVIE